VRNTQTNTAKEQLMKMILTAIINLVVAGERHLEALALALTDLGGLSTAEAIHELIDALADARHTWAVDHGLIESLDDERPHGGHRGKPEVQPPGK